MENQQSIYDFKMNKSLGYKPLVVASIFVVTVLGFYFYKFHVGLSKENGDWGTFGDFFGGVMNPILGFINLFLLSTTLTLQIKSTQNQDKNTHIQEISAKIVAIGHLLEITTQQISNLSSYVHLLKTNELKRLDLLREHQSAYLNDLHKQYDLLNTPKKDN